MERAKLILGEFWGQVTNKCGVKAIDNHKKLHISWCIFQLSCPMLHALMVFTQFESLDLSKILSKTHLDIFE